MKNVTITLVSLLLSASAFSLPITVEYLIMLRDVSPSEAVAELEKNNEWIYQSSQENALGKFHVLYRNLGGTKTDAFIRVGYTPECYPKIEYITVKMDEMKAFESYLNKRSKPTVDKDTYTYLYRGYGISITYNDAKNMHHLLILY